MTTRAVVRWGALACAVVACVGFLALGAWQVERRAWKLRLIERVDRRVHAPPVEITPRDGWAAVDAADDEYRHVRARGTLLNESETLVQASTELGAGFWVMTPLRLADGSLVFVNRGFVPPSLRERNAHGAGGQAGETTIVGLLRMNEPHGGFLRSNDPSADRWYSRDVQAIAEARGLHGAAPFFIDADAGVPADAATHAAALPVGGLTVIAFHNNHAVYAFTWFVLALISAYGAWRVWRGDATDAEAREAHASRT